MHTLDKDFHGLPVLCLADLSNNLIKSISIDLVKHTKCSKHGVTNKLEILLQGNYFKYIFAFEYEMKLFLFLKKILYCVMKIYQI